MPACQYLKGIHTYQQAQTDSRHFLAQRDQRIQRIGRPFPVKLAGVDLEYRVIFNQLPDFSSYNQEWMRWQQTGNQPDFIQAKKLLNFEGRPQMTIVNRIKGSAENSNHREMSETAGIRCECARRR